MRAFLVAAAFAALVSGVAQADPTEIRVPYTAADLQSETSLAALMAKLEAAAKVVCPIDHSQPLVLQDTKECRKEAVREAIATAKLGPLSYYYATVKGERAPVIESPTLASR